MAIEIESLSVQHIPAVIAHLRKTRFSSWSESELEDFVNWRYFSRTNAEPVIALAKGECIAFIDSQLRDYKSSGQNYSVQETSEWYCQPAYQPIGLGIRVLQTLMRREQPILSVRGTEISQKIVLKLGWNNLSPVLLFNKMNNWRSTARSTLKRFSSIGRKLGSDNEQYDLHAIESPPSNSELEQLRSRQFSALAPNLHPWEIEWFSTAPENVGEYVWLRFMRGTEFVGYSISRLYEGKEYRRAQIVHLECVDDDLSLYQSAIDLLTQELTQRSAVRILSRCSSPKIADAYIHNDYSASSPQPVFWWSQSNAEFPDKDSHLTYLRGDDSFRPLSRDRER